MLEKFQKIVDLKDRTSKRGASLSSEKKKITQVVKRKSTKEKTFSPNSETVQAQAIDEMFGGHNDGEENSLHKIIRAGKNYDALLYKIGAGISAVVVIFALFSFFSHKDQKTVVMGVEEKKPTWSAVVLTGGEIYYGLVTDVNKNPVIIDSVYYDFDQTGSKLGLGDSQDSGNLRLVKRGKESYGPDGSMTIYQAQIKYIETLKDDSKVLQAILEHEKQ